MKRSEIIDLVRATYDPVPRDWPHHRRRDWDDGTGEIADKIVGGLHDVLKQHWITAIICDEATHTDRVGCWCGTWQCPPQPNVGAAVDAWIEHVLGTVSRPDRGDVQ